MYSRWRHTFSVQRQLRKTASTRRSFDRQTHETQVALAARRNHPVLSTISAVTPRSVRKLRPSVWRSACRRPQRSMRSLVMDFAGGRPAGRTPTCRAGLQVRCGRIAQRAINAPARRARPQTQFTCSEFIRRMRLAFNLLRKLSTT